MASYLTVAARAAIICLAVGLVTGLHLSIALTNHTTVALNLLLVVLAVATVWRLPEAIVASLVAAACFNYFFLPPVGKWTIADPENWIALFTFLVVSVVASQLSERARRQAREALEHQKETARLAELAQRAELVRQSEEFKSTLLDALAHELKTPLTSLKASVSALRAGASQPSSQGELQAIIEEETDRLTRLVSEILHMARIEAGKVRLNRSPCPAGELVSKTLEDSRRLMNGRTVEVRIAPSLPPVSADADLVETALHNLLDNAVKYSAPGTPIEIRAEATDAEVRFSVLDRGPGLAEGELSRVFEPYYRARTADDSATGLGMGLAIAREIVVAHGGRIWAESTAGNGTSFSFTLPRAGQP